MVHFTVTSGCDFPFEHVNKKVLGKFGNYISVHSLKYTDTQSIQGWKGPSEPTKVVASVPFSVPSLCIPFAFFAFLLAFLSCLHLVLFLLPLGLTLNSVQFLSTENIFHIGVSEQTFVRSKVCCSFASSSSWVTSAHWASSVASLGLSPETTWASPNQSIKVTMAYTSSFFLFNGDISDYHSTISLQKSRRQSSSRKVR